MKPVTTTKALITLNDGHDQAAAKRLNKLFHDAQIGLRRVVALGLFAWELKERRLKHGQFGPWLAAHCPKLSTIDSVTGKAKPSSALSTYMSLTQGVLESTGFTVEKYLNHISNSQQMGICHGGNYLLLPDKKLPEEAKSLKQKICELVDGKTQRQLFLEFKQTDDGEKPKVGRLKGQGGASHDQRVAAALTEEQRRLDLMETRAAELHEWILEVSDAQGLALLSAPTRAKLTDAFLLALNVLKSVNPN
jgi:hypothetical protein